MAAPARPLSNYSTIVFHQVYCQVLLPHFIIVSYDILMLLACFTLYFCKIGWLCSNEKYEKSENRESLPTTIRYRSEHHPVTTNRCDMNQEGILCGWASIKLLRRVKSIMKQPSRINQCASRIKTYFPGLACWDLNQNSRYQDQGCCKTVE
jgi:hypothetical protein